MSRRNNNKVNQWLNNPNNHFPSNSRGGSSQTNNQNTNKSSNKRISTAISSASSSYSPSTSSSQSSIQPPKRNELNRAEARRQNLMGYVGLVNKAAEGRGQNQVIKDHLKGMGKALKKANTDEAENHKKFIKREIKKREYQEEKKGLVPSQQERHGNNHAGQLVNYAEKKMDFNKLKKQQNQSTSSKGGS
ncbi:39828_t:CDS:2, partial [Gigaspora margarita]